MLLALILAAAPDYDAHIALQRKIHGAAVADLDTVVEAPFVVWGDAGKVQVQRSAQNIVRWAVTHLEVEHFSKRPPGIHDIFLFKDEESYLRHALKLFGHAPETPFGYASREHKALVMNIGTGGGTLVHELVHPYFAANYPDVPSWLNEGLASLYEQCDERGGKMVGLTNWRLAGLKEGFAQKKVQPIAKLIATTEAAFRDDAEALNYAQARYLMMYLQEKDLLHAFVRRALAQQNGAAALKETLGPKAWQTIDADFKAWVATLSFPERGRD